MQTSIQMQLRAACDVASLERLLDQINPAARTVELIAEQLEGGAGRVAKAAVHTLAHELRRLLSGGIIAKLRTELCLHCG